MKFLPSAKFVAIAQSSPVYKIYDMISHRSKYSPITNGTQICGAKYSTSMMGSGGVTDFLSPQPYLCHEGITVALQSKLMRCDEIGHLYH